MRTCSPTATVTGRPERCTSSAIWTPVAEAPTTSTPPGASAAGLRYSNALRAVTVAGGAPPNSGTLATLNPPEANTTVLHCQRPWSVSTM